MSFKVRYQLNKRSSHGSSLRKTANETFSTATFL